MAALTSQKNSPHVVSVDHRAPAFFGTATAGIAGLECVGHRFVAEQAVVKRQLFAPKHCSARFDENAPLHQIGHAIGSARMVDPFGIVAAIQRIDHATIVQMKVERVVGVVGVVRMPTNRLGHGDDLAHVFNDPFAYGHVPRGKNTFAMHIGRQHLNRTDG